MTVSSKYKIFLEVIKTILAFVVALPAIPVVFVLVVFLLLYRYLVYLLAKVLKSEFVSIVGPRDAFFVADGAKERPSTLMPGILVVKGAVDLGHVQNWFATKVLQEKRDKGEKLKYGKLMQIQKYWLGFWWWAWDPNFKVEHHVRLCEEISGNEIVTEEKLLSLIGKMANKPMTAGMPAWEFLLIPNYQNGDEEEKSLFLYRVSHSYCDGYSLLKMVLSSFAEENLNKLPYLPRASTTCLEQFFFYVYLFFRLPHLYWEQRSFRDTNGLRFPRGKFKDEWVAAMSRPIPLSLMKDLKKKYGFSFQTLVCSALSQGLSKYMEKKKMVVPESVHVSAPFPWPQHPDDKLCNHWTGGCYTIELNKQLSLAELNRTQEMVRQLNGSHSLIANYWTTKLVCLLPTSLAGPLCTQRGATVMLSNVAGPSEKISVFGVHPLEDVMFWMCLAKGLASVGVSVLSYGESIRLALMADKVAIPDAKDVADLCNIISQSLENLLHTNFEFEQVSV